ncbi:MAG: C4-type zinc ribbon domain-containing protein [Chloroflexota bacterium]
MSAALGLLRLQQVDSRLDQLESKLEGTRAELENDAEVAAARRTFEAAQAEQEEAERRRLAAEMQASSQRRKLQHAESALYGGSVRNPKELQDLQADVASLKRHLAALEEAELGWMEKLESAERQCGAARDRLDQDLGRAQSAESRLLAQQASLLRTKESLQAERSAAVSAISERLLETYENLRGSRRGVAVAEVNDNACGACGTVLTAALQQSARHATQLVHCPSCGRILYGG